MRKAKAVSVARLYSVTDAPLLAAGHAPQVRKARAKKVTYTESQLYTGRQLIVKHGAKTLTGRVSNGGQCRPTQFAFSGEDGTEACIARSAIVQLLT